MKKYTADQMIEYAKLFLQYEERDKFIKMMKEVYGVPDRNALLIWKSIDVAYLLWNDLLV
jgi:hypothetical protein